MITRLEIFFVVDLKKFRDFKIAHPTGHGLLSVFGWKKEKKDIKFKLMAFKDGAMKRFVKITDLLYVTRIYCITLKYVIYCDLRYTFAVYHMSYLGMIISNLIVMK